VVVSQFGWHDVHAFRQNAPMGSFFHDASDSAGRWSLIGLGVGFFTGCIAVLWDDMPWYRLDAIVKVGAIAAFFAAGGAAMGILMQGIIQVH
jgi:hypothetical protein